MFVPTSLTQSYDPGENILEVSHTAPILLDTREEIVAYFDGIVGFWRARCGGRKAYYLVDWRNFEVNMRAGEVYAENVKRVVSGCAITIVRFTGNPLQRAAGRLVALKLHVPSHVYDDRDQALAVIRQLRAGTLRIATS